MTRPRRAYLLQKVLDVWELDGAIWVQGSYGWLVGPSRPVTWLHKGARGYCIAGALLLVAAGELLEAGEIAELVGALALVLDLDESDAFALEHWNDEPGRTYADVRAAIGAAVKVQASVPAGAWL